MPTARKLPSGNYRVRVFIGMDGDKKVYKSITAPTKKEAEYLATKIKLNNTNRTHDMTLHEASENYIKIKDGVLSPSTVAGYKEILRNRFLNIQNVKLSKINQILLDREISRELKKVSAKTIKNAYGFYSTVIRYFIPYARLNVKIPQKPKKEKHIPTVQEFWKVAQNLKERNSDFEASYLMMGMLGLRASEVRALTDEDIDLERKIVYINKASVRGTDGEYHIKATKTKASTRCVELPEILSERLKQPYTFDLKNNQMGAKLSHACKLCNIEPFTQHALRHFYVSVLHMIGIPASYGMARTGHTTLKMYDDNYNHQFNEFDKAVNKKINDFFNNI